MVPMLGFTLTRRVNVPIERTFAVFTDFETAPNHIDAIEKVELLTDGPIRAGTRFRETRIIRGSRVTEELEIAQLEPNEGYAVRCDTGTCLIKTACLMRKDGGGTKVEVALQLEPKTFLAGLKVRLLMPAMRKELEKDLDALKKAAEAVDTAVS